MKDTYFVKHEHTEVFIDSVSTVVLWDLIWIAAFLFLLIRDKIVDPIFFIICLLNMLITFLFIRQTSMMGLHINGKDITIKGFFKTKKIDPRDIVAIKISQSYFPSNRRYLETPVKDKHGAPLFTAFLLKSLDTDILISKGSKEKDTAFHGLHSRHIICQIIYDQNAIDYLKSLNPNIQII